MTSLLPLLLIVLCPIVMVIMMRGMHSHGVKSDAEKAGPGGNTMNTAELLRLRQDLEQRIDELDTRLDELNASGRAASDVGTIRP